MRCVNHNLQHAERIAGNDSKICKICNTKRCGNDRNLHLYSCGHIFISVCAIIFASLFGLNGVWLSFLGSEVITFAVILVLECKP